MSNYKIGYGKPPVHFQFKKGFCPNPKGRPKKKELDCAAIQERFMDERIGYMERGRRRSATRRELTIRRLVAEALKGNIQSATLLLDLRESDKAWGSLDGRIIISGGLPDDSDEFVAAEFDAEPKR